MATRRPSCSEQADTKLTYATKRRAKPLQPGLTCSHGRARPSRTADLSGVARKRLALGSPDQGEGGIEDGTESRVRCLYRPIGSNQTTRFYSLQVVPIALLAGSRPVLLNPQAAKANQRK